MTSRAGTFTANCLHKTVQMYTTTVLVRDCKHDKLIKIRFQNSPQRIIGSTVTVKYEVIHKKFP